MPIPGIAQIEILYNGIFRWIVDLLAIISNNNCFV